LSGAHPVVVRETAATGRTEAPRDGVGRATFREPVDWPLRTVMAVRRIVPTTHPSETNGEGRSVMAQREGRMTHGITSSVKSRYSPLE
jgi:hypothetical protein